MSHQKVGTKNAARRVPTFLWITFFRKPLDFFNLLGYIIAMEDNDIQTTKLLDMVCEGVNTPTDQEENETLELQEDNFESV